MKINHEGRRSWRGGSSLKLNEVVTETSEVPSGRLKLTLGTVCMVAEGFYGSAETLQASIL